MYKNIGAKIKGLAQFILWSGIIMSVIGAIICFANSNQEPGLITTGVVFLVVGPLSSWMGSLLTYGFGELIERAKSVDEKLSNSYSDLYDIPDDVPIDPSWNQPPKKSSRYDDLSNP